MGASITLDKGYIKAEGKLKGAIIDFKVSSVGATGNVLMGCVNINEEVVINNAEPNGGAGVYVRLSKW